MALAESSRVRSGSAARATAVRAWCPRVPEERLERAESRLRGWDRRTADPKVIESDVPPTRPGRGDAQGARGGLSTNAFVKSEESSAGQG